MRPLLAALPLLPVLPVLPVLVVPPVAAAGAAPSATVPTPVRQGVWPLDPRPRVVRGFDPPASAWGAGHRGVDLLGRPGQVVRSALPGTVLFAGVLAGRGVVVVGHGGLRTTYEPVSASVGVGDVVGRGGAVGRLALAGSHCFPRSCLHWGLRRGEAYLDPLVLVGAGPLRLLPLDALGGTVAGRGPAGPRGLAPAVRAPAFAVPPVAVTRTVTVPVARRVGGGTGAWSGAGVRQPVRLAQAL